MKLVEESKNAHRLWSVQAGTLTVVLTILDIVVQVLPLWEQALPGGIFSYLAAITGTATIALRLIKQRGIEDG